MVRGLAILTRVSINIYISKTCKAKHTKTDRQPCRSVLFLLGIGKIALVSFTAFQKSSRRPHAAQALRARPPGFSSLLITISRLPRKYSRHDAAGSTDRLVPATISVSQFEISGTRRHEPMIRRLAVERDLRPHDIAAFRTARHAGRFQDKIQSEALSAAHAEILVYAAVQFEHVSASRFLVQAVDILRDNRRHPAHPFHLGQPDMHDVRLCIRLKHVLFIKIVENIRMQAENEWLSSISAVRPSYSSHTVRFSPRKSGIPLGTDTPAPPKKTMRARLAALRSRVHVLPLLPISVLSSFSFHCITAHRRLRHRATHHIPGEAFFQTRIRAEYPSPYIYPDPLIVI